MARPQRPRPGEALLAPFRVLAGGEDLATAGTALLERACRDAVRLYREER